MAHMLDAVTKACEMHCTPHGASPAYTLLQGPLNRLCQEVPHVKARAVLRYTVTQLAHAVTQFHVTPTSWCGNQLSSREPPDHLSHDSLQASKHPRTDQLKRSTAASPQQQIPESLTPLSLPAKLNTAHNHSQHTGPQCSELHCVQQRSRSHSRPAASAPKAPCTQPEMRTTPSCQPQCCQYRAEWYGTHR